MDGFLIAFVCLFVLNLIVLIAYVGPILGEIKGILSDVRSITSTGEQRVKKIDAAMEKVLVGMASVRGASQIFKFFRRFGKKRQED